MKIIVIISRLIQNCSKHRIHHLAAAFSYYFILSIPAIVMLIFNYGSNYFASEMILDSIMPNLEKIFGSESLDTIIRLFTSASTSKSHSLYAIISIVVLLLTASQVFIFVKVSYTNYNRIIIHKNQIVSFFKGRLFSILLTFAILMFFFTALFLSPILQNIEKFFINPKINTIKKTIYDYFFSPLLFAFLYSLFVIVIMEKIPYRFAFFSGLLTSILGKLANLILKMWIPKTLIGSFFAKTGSSLIILIYIYYIGLIIFIGLEFSSTLMNIKVFHRNYDWITRRHIIRLFNSKKNLLNKILKKNK